MIDELRTTLDRQVERIVPVPDPYGRLLSRRRRFRLRRGLIASAVAAVLLLAVPRGLVAGHSGPAPEPTGTVPIPLLRGLIELLDSPTRGDLAPDVAFLDRMRQRAAGTPGMPRDRAAIRVLFAGDVPGGQLLVIMAGVTSRPQWTAFLGTKAAANGNHVQLSTPDDLRPVVEYRGERFLLYLGPASCQSDVSGDPRYLADGTIARTWVRQAGCAVVLPYEQMSAAGRLRMTLAGKRLYETPLALPQNLTATVDPTPVTGGRPEPVAANQVADVVARTTGLTDARARYRVLWSDEIPMAGLPDSGTAIIATVVAVTPDGGGPYATFAFDPANPKASARNVPTGSGVLGDPSRSLIAMRLPYYTGSGPGDRLQIVAPPTAVRFDLTRDGRVLSGGTLDRGAGYGSLPLPGSATVRAYDGSGRVVAQRDFVDNENNITNLYESTYQSW